jgi:energy-coupling factor transporter transmembrane protein EcfT
MPIRDRKDAFLYKAHVLLNLEQRHAVTYEDVAQSIKIPNFRGGEIFDELCREGLLKGDGTRAGLKMTAKGTKKVNELLEREAQLARELKNELPETIKSINEEGISSLSGIVDYFNPYKILKASIAVIPELKFALGLLGLFSVLEIAFGVFNKPIAVVSGVVVLIALMIVLSVFVFLTKIGHRHILFPAKFLLWTSVLITCLLLFFIFTATVFQWPNGFYKLLYDENSIAFKTEKPTKALEENKVPSKPTKPKLSNEDMFLLDTIKKMKLLVNRGCEVLAVCGNEDGSYKQFKFADLYNDWQEDISVVLNQELIVKDWEYKHWNRSGDSYLGGVGFDQMDKSAIFPVKDAPVSAFDKGLYRGIQIKMENLKYYIFEIQNRLKGIKKPLPPEAMKSNVLKCSN